MIKVGNNVCPEKKICSPIKKINYFKHLSILQNPRFLCYLGISCVIPHNLPGSG